MDKEQVATAAVLAVVLIGLPMGLLALCVHSSQPKDRETTVREIYPDDHLFV